MIVHLGDVGQEAIPQRLAGVAPVLVPAGDNKGYVPPTGDTPPIETIQSGGLALGLTFNVANPEKPS